MFKATLLAGTFLLSGLCFGQNTSFRQHQTPETLTQVPELKKDLDQIRNLEQLSEQAVTSSRSRGTEVQQQLQAAYKTYLSDLKNLLNNTVSEADKKTIEAEEQFVSTFIH